MNLSRLARICAPVILTVGLLGLAAPAGASTVVDYIDAIVLNGCTIRTAGVNNDTNTQTQSYTYNANSCGKATCIRESALLNGSVYWASEAACTTGSFGQYSISPAVGGTYFGRQIRVGSTCYWDTVYDNPTVHSCI